ncbi:hypothetical protein, partial [Pseudomonas syringae group genomosp. 7]
MVFYVSGGGVVVFGVGGVLGLLGGWVVVGLLGGLWLVVLFVVRLVLGVVGGFLFVCLLLVFGFWVVFGRGIIGQLGVISWLCLLCDSDAFSWWELSTINLRCSSDRSIIG